MRAADAEGGAGVCAALRLGHTGLRFGEGSAAEIVREFQAAAFGDGLGEQFGLIEPALPTFAPMHGNGNHAIEPLIQRQRANEQATKRPRKRFDLGVFEKMDQLAQRAIVTAVRVSSIEVRGTLAADGTQVVFIQRVIIGERRAAGAAEELG